MGRSDVPSPKTGQRCGREQERNGGDSWEVPSLPSAQLVTVI